MGEGIAALISLIANLVSMATTVVGGYTSNAAKIIGFNKQGELEDAIITNMQNRYSGLEDAIASAKLEQYQEDLKGETEARVRKSSLVTLIVSIIIAVVVIAAVLWLLKNDD